MTEPLPVGALDRDPELDPYWTAIDGGQLVLPRCAACGHTWWYPRPRCPYCTSADVSWEPHDGRGTVYTLTVNRRPQGAYAELDHVVIAYVELDNGLRLLTNLVETDGVEVGIGTPVEPVFQPAGEGRVLRFRPVRRREQGDRP